MSVTKFLTGFAVGAAIGAIAGILLAPKSGAETREMIGDMASDVARKTDETVKDLQRKADNIVSDVQEKSEEIMEKIQDMLNKQKKVLKVNPLKILLKRGELALVLLFFINICRNLNSRRSIFS